MNATTMTDPTPTTAPDDTTPRFFIDDAFDASADGDWWLDLGHIDLPNGVAA